MTTIFVSDKDKLPERHKNDLYITEKTLIDAAMKWASPVFAQSVLDIGAGDGRWGDAAARYTGAKTVIGVELEYKETPPGFSDWYSATDYLTWASPIPAYDFIVSNPPYYIAEKIIRKAWKELANGGTMIMLFPLQFQSSMGRYNGLWSTIYPYKVGVLSRRPSFYGGKTSGTDYALYQWVKAVDGKPHGRPRSWITELVTYERENKS